MSGGTGFFLKKRRHLLKRQGQITNDLKALRKIKSDLMKEIIDNSADTGDTDAKRNKIMARDQKLVMEAKE